MVTASGPLHTDQAQLYKAIGQRFGSHERIRHNAGVYVAHLPDGSRLTPSRIEGFRSGLKRQLHGTHRIVSRKHLHR